MLHKARQLRAVRWLQRRFPALFHFLLQRFNPKKLYGLPLTLVLLVGAVQLSLLSELTEQVMEAEEMVQVDRQLTSALYNGRTSLGATFFLGATQLGGQLGAIGLGLLLSFFLARQKRWRSILVFWLVLGAVGLSVRYGKEWLQRPRPENVAYVTYQHFSFPSGHSTTATALFGMGAYLLARHVRQRRYWLYTGAAIAVVLVGFSRMYLGAHYLSDVLAGFLLGSLWVLVGISLLEWLQYRRRSGTSPSAAP
ncbi:MULTISPECIES: phosphatase PAP2 family protein [Rufibacter]|uniref:Undecaprenyl-diphosphatase n=1 Tax=Rufibacter quisquiliarum TaxID=1549639 RepID=A0A839GIB6_9BACT|nr:MULTISPECIES: phosphatase PAP2 family protein [Rufibacter]MBA9078612.1 undecaprenyl-diphosphatase [Rufibacter quisquiliarum]